ncbi:MAG: hypothetical protein ABIS17_04150 [Casimicrobiaceae bacterium]
MIAALRNRFGNETFRLIGIIADHRAIIDSMQSEDAEDPAIIAAAHRHRAKADLLPRMADAEANDPDCSIGKEST